MTTKHDYDDDYGTCLDTYGTVRVFSDALSPERISAALGVEPTHSFKKGDLKAQHKVVTIPRHPTNGWFYSTKGQSTSRDCRRHLDMLIERVLTNVEAIADLRRQGCDIDLTVFYSYTQGGPTISPAQMRSLAAAGVDVWWDLYRASEDEAGSARDAGA